VSAMSLAWICTAPGVGAQVDGAGSAALGVGAFGHQPATSIDLRVDVVYRDLAFGIGGRVHWLVGDRIRSEEWDETSELAAVLRYASYQRAADERWPGIALAAGTLAEVQVGYGALIDRYTAGVDADHRRLGVRGAVQGTRWGGELFADDVVAPRLLAGRGRTAGPGNAELGLTLAGDLAQELALASVELAHPGRYLVPYTALAAMSTAGAGLHLGVRGRVPVGGSWQLRAGLEGRVGTSKYVPGWVGPLYDVDAASTEERARMGLVGGVGSRAEVGLEIERVLSITAAHVRRAGLADQVSGRVGLPHYRPLQVGAWAAAELHGAERALAAEVRSEFARGWFAVAELARRYRDEDGAPAPVWIGTIAFGATVGF
jgi:hypothetical protein